MTATSSAPRGLTAAQVADRVAAGQVNRVPTRTSRTVGQIVRANVLTPFNAVLGVLLVVILVVGPLQDALFGLVLVVNSAVGIVQEVRAKRTLDRLSLLTAPTASVLRDGAVREVPAADVVLDDVLVLHRGDQVVVDAEVLEADGLELDESLLTGEAEPVVKAAGDGLLSGSFVVAGRGTVRASRVGASAYAAGLAAEARRFALVRSELRDSLDRLLRVLGLVLVPTGTVLVVTQLLVEQESLDVAVRASVAALVGMVPEGLVLLTSIALAVGVVRLGARGVLVQEMPALEGLARVDVVGIDKTGTLTEGAIRVAGLELVGPDRDEVQVRRVLAGLAAVDEHPDASLSAVRAAFGPSPLRPRSTIPFASERRWSAADLGADGTWVIGAPDVLLPAGHPVLARVGRHADRGDRVLLLGSTASLAEGHAAPEPVALVVLAEQVRGDAAATLRYFREEGVAVKVISGDAPRTVAAVAGALGLPGADRPVDARSLPGADGPADALGGLVGDPVAEEAATARLGDVVTGATVFGRVTPRQKQQMVRALRARGHVVAMTGDGVNDVLALKEADLGVAMGSGAPAARAVAQLVLLPSRFDVLPDVVAEGRRVIANVERVAHLFLTKTVYVAVLAVAVALTQHPFPFYPRHLTLVSSLTIGIPAFVLALAPNRRRARRRLLRRVLRFAVPAGVVVAVATFLVFTWVLDRVGVDEARTAATVVLLGGGTGVLTVLVRPRSPGAVLLLTSVVATFAAVLAVPWTRDFFALTGLPADVWTRTGLTVAGLTVVLAVVHRVARGQEAGADPG